MRKDVEGMKSSIKIIWASLTVFFIIAMLWSPVFSEDGGDDSEFNNYTPVSGQVSRDLMENSLVKEGTQATFTGSIIGNIAVKKGGTAIIKGSLSGSIINMGTVKIYGTMNGNIKNRGGDLYVYGTVTGVIYKKGGKVTIDKNANFLGTQLDE